MLAHLCEQQGREGRGLGGLQDNGVSARERRSNFPGEHKEWEIPRNDLTGNANGTGIRSEPRVFEFVCPTCVVEEPVRDERDIDIACFLDRLSIVQRFQNSELPSTLLHDAGDPIQVLRAFSGWQL